MEAQTLAKTYYDLEQSGKRITINQGGSRSGKTYSILLKLIEYAYDNKGNKPSVITICRKTLPSLKGSVYRDFMEILENEGIYNVRSHNKSEPTYRLFNTLFEFISLDQPQKVRGRKRNVLFINEANEIDFDSWIQLSMRTTDKIILDYNPSMTPNHWIIENVKPRDDTDFYVTTYLDNPFLEQSLIDEIERLKSVNDGGNYWKIYGLGELGLISGLVFQNWEIIDGWNPDTKLLGYGLDFGFSNDPTALTKVGIYNSELILHECLYHKGLVNVPIKDYKTGEIKPNIHDFLNKLNITQVNDIIADCAEPKSISELLLKGWNIKKSSKGADSINQGIDIMRRYKINITSSSRNLIKEFSNYKYDDKEGILINKPIDAFNHSIDGVRYLCRYKLGKPQFAMPISR